MALIGGGEYIYLCNHEVREGLMVVGIYCRCRAYSPILMIWLLSFFAQYSASAEVPAGHVASHGIERDAINADGTGEGAGYFTFIEGIPGPFFSGAPSEATAFFTFRSEPFSTSIISNGNVVALLHPPGQLTVYLNKLPSGNWNDFNTFSRGQPIATFEFGTTQDIRAGSVQIGYTSARIIAAEDFEFHGSKLNFEDLFPHGVTLNFIVSPTPLNSSFPLIFSLGFSSFAIGPGSDQ
jgi:hypothetical protein